MYVNGLIRTSESRISQFVAILTHCRNNSVPIFDLIMILNDIIIIFIIE